MKDGANIGVVRGIKPRTFPVVLSPDVFAFDPERRVIQNEDHDEQGHRPDGPRHLARHGALAGA
jgi:hypothetical protein